MAIEIERKYLVANGNWRPLVTKRVRLRQAYLAVEGRASVRVRVLDRSEATLTVKSRKAGLRRAEFEYAIPVADAEQLVLLRQGALIEKVRHIVPWQGLTWEIDTFEGENAGLEIAEVELDHESQPLNCPPGSAPRSPDSRATTTAIWRESLSSSGTRPPRLALSPRARLQHAHEDYCDQPAAA